MESCEGAKKSKVCISALLPGLMHAAIVGLVMRLSKITDFEGKRGPGQVFSFILCDDTGDIRVSVFGKDLKPFLDVCREGVAVRISGGWVKKADPRYSTTDNEHELTVSIDQSGAIVRTLETVTRRAPSYKKIKEISDCEMKMNVNVYGTISAVQKPTEVKTGFGKLVNLAKVTLVDQSGSSVSCTFWSSSSAQVNDWSVGDVLAIHGAQVQEYSQTISLGCSKAEIQHWPEDSADVSVITQWYKDAVSSQQCFEEIRVTQSSQREKNAIHDDEMVLQYPERMFKQFDEVRRIRVRFGDKEVTFSRDQVYRSQQIPAMSTPKAPNESEKPGPTHDFMDE